MIHIFPTVLIYGMVIVRFRYSFVWENRINNMTGEYIYGVLIFSSLLPLALTTNFIASHLLHTI